MGIRRVWMGALIGVTGVAALALGVAPGRVGAAIHWVYSDLPAVSYHGWQSPQPAGPRPGGSQAPGHPGAEPTPQPEPKQQSDPAPAPAPVPKPDPTPAPEPAPPAATPESDPAPATNNTGDGGQTPAPTPKPTPPPTPDPTPAHASGPSSATPAGQPLRRVAAAEPHVVLTFDDGPSSYNPQLTAILKAEQIPAAFFWIGGNIKPGQAAELTSQGFQLGSHTMTHARMTTLSADGQHAELSRSLKAIQPATTTFFRPPFGAYNAEVMQSAKALGLTVIMWDVDSRDWDLAAHPEQIVPNVMSHVRSGSIILLHERAQTVKVLPQLIKALRAAGYSFQALPG